VGRGCGARRDRAAIRGHSEGRKQPGLPSGDEILQPGEEASQGGEDQGVHGRDHPGLGGAPGGLCAHVVRQGGNLLGQGWEGLI